MVGEDRFFEVFVDTPIEECERRDTKVCTLAPSW
jgi:sulfate adenylyltransferase